MRSSIPLRFAIVVISIAFYWIALTHPACLFRFVHVGPGGVRTEGALKIYSGSDMLHRSILGPFQVNLAGLANPLLWLSWFFLLSGRFKYAAIGSLSGITFSLQTFQVFLMPMPMDESGGNFAELVQLLPGYYLWAASILIVFLASWYEGRKPQVTSDNTELRLR